MEFGHLFEALMLVCFGFSWPLNVIKAYKARTAKGTSLAFIFLIITGYLAGITAKFINHQFNYVLAVYFLNLAIVMMNVLVYIRNKGLDKKAAAKNQIQIIKTNTASIGNTQEENMNYTYSLDEFINPKGQSNREEKNAVILLGNGLDTKIPVQSLGKEFKFNFKIYNKSCEKLSSENVKEYFSEAIAPLAPEGIMIHLGENDLNLCMNNSALFDTKYFELIQQIKSINKKCRIALISLANPQNNKAISLVNRHIKAIADSEKCSYVNLDNAHLWNPAATKAAVEFAHSMGLNTRKPLNDVAEILYSYEFNVLAEDTSTTNLVG
ncbi:MAG: hypothetical protein J6T20_09555 [Treponema sp.]|nr:hypothetical protein [Treponema sp.]